jgi:hypothetical protein
MRPRLSRSRQREFWRLVRAGVPWRQAAGPVGMSLKTAQCWFAKSGGMPSLSLAEPSRELNLSDRELIFERLKEGLSYAAIGRELGRPTSTITRELDLHRKDPRRPRAEPRGRETPRRGFKRQRLNYSPSVAQARADGPRHGPNPPSWPSIRGCVTRWRLGSNTITAPSRSVPGLWSIFPMIRRCGCPTKPSIDPCMCKGKGR